jgi:hypothetical protein
MSVVKSKRGESELQVVTKSIALASYTIHICSNEKNFPKRYRWCLTGKIVEHTIEICNNVNKANSVYVSSARDYQTRRQYQNTALAASYALLTMMDIAYNTFNIDDKRIEHWVGLVIDVQNLIRNWRKSDSEKHKNLK